MKEFRMEKSTNYDESLLAEKKALKVKINELNDLLIKLSKTPISVIQTISNLEEKLQVVEEKIKQQNNIIASEKAVDFNLLQEIKDPQELNMMLKRVIEKIIIFNSNDIWRIKVLYRNRHSQNFLWDGEKISFRSDTNKLLEFTKKLANEE